MNENQLARLEALVARLVDPSLRDGIKRAVASRARVFRARANDSGKRVPCGGKRRSDGKPCEALSVPGKRRCKWHGGCSTGPRTSEGKARALANLRQVRRAMD